MWSTTLTAESFELAGDDDTLRLVGYLWLSDFNQRGELSDSDFNLRGTTHYVRGLFQNRDDWSLWLIIDPPPDAQDVRSMTLTADGQALAVSDAALVEENDVLGAVVIWPDPGFRWSDAQRLAVQLTTGQDGGGANQAPRATGSIPAQTLSVGGSAASVNVARYFTDPDGDALTYTARSSRTGVVTAAVSGSTVTLAPVAAGTVTVTVTARDPAGLTATQSITVTVADDGAANALWSTTLTAESFELAGDDDTLRLVGYLWLSDFNQRGELSDSDFNLRGTTHYVRGLFQNRDDWSLWLIIDPPPDAQDVRSMTLTADGQALAVSDAALVEENDVLGAVVIWPDPGFRWSDAQRIAVQLTTGQDGGGANQAPRATGSIPAQTLSVGGSAASVNVARYFTDPDGDTLTYTASSNRTGIVRASASGSTVTLAPVAAGTATVTVTARDPGSLTATQSIAVMVEGDGGTGSGDRAALEAFYDATGGSNWTDDTNWLTDAPLGDWYGVTTDASGRVTRLELDDNSLTGSIPSALGSLVNLDRLDLSSNELSGPIPSVLGNLANLVVLRLSRNELSGSVPGWLGNMRSLLVLYLLGNELTGGIPEELGNLNLWGLGLSWNDLSVGPIPAWLRNDTNLRWLYLSGSDVTGGIPAWLGNQTNLEDLFLDSNELTGSIPGALGNLAHLERLDLGYNWGVTGSLPSGLRRASLERLDLLVTQACAPAAWQDWLATIDFTGRLCGAATDVEIDVAVVYTRAARDAAGGVAAIEAEIDLMVAETNQAYTASGVHHRVALVDRSEVLYSETGDSTLDLRRLLDPSDGHLDEVHTLRDQVGADLVHLIVGEADDICGQAYLPGVFGLTLQGCGGRTFAHELGHNMGLQHDRYQEHHNEDGVLTHPAYGYVNQRAFESGALPSSRWRSIMAYNAQCDDDGFFCSTPLRFSNPGQRFNGDPLGISYGAGGSGVTGPADAVAVLNATGPAVALWRDRVPSGANRPPTVVGTLPDRSLAPAGTLDVDVSQAFRDPDGDPLTYAVSSSAPGLVAVRALGARVTLTAVGEGAATIRVTATDPGGLSAAQSFAVTVERSNQPPEAVGTLPDRTLELDATLDVDVSPGFVDPDGDALTYTVTSSAPQVATVRVAGARVTLRAVGEGAAVIRVTATDPGGLRAAQSFAVTVERPNQPPASVGTLPDRTLELDATLDVNVSPGFVDPDGDALTYTVTSSAPQVATARVAGARVTLRAVGEGAAVIEVTATDPGGLSAAQSFAVTVERSNQPPEAVETLPDVRLPDLRATLDVDVSPAFVDADGDALTYMVSSLAPQVATARVAGARVTLTAVGIGRAVIEVTATDPDGLSATQLFGVRVSPPFTDDPIRSGVTPIKAVHFTELRARIDILRGEAGLGPFRWTDRVLRAGVTRVRLTHLLELRDALAAAYAAAGRSAPRWTDTAPVGGTTPIRAAHLTELRAAVSALE